MENYATVLLVEDDVSLAEWVKDYLSQQGFKVELCARGDLAVERVKAVNPELVLLDLMLPGLDGISVCRSLKRFYSGPIIMLTARDDEMDEVIGLEVGATDYIIKPVRPRALLARIKTALRHEQDIKRSEPEPRISFGALSIDLPARRVTLDSEPVNLSSAEYNLLSFLAQHADQIVDRDTVFRKVKGREYDGLDRSIDVVISALRKKFADNPQQPEKIKTVWGQGYLLVSDAW